MTHHLKQIWRFIKTNRMCQAIEKSMKPDVMRRESIDRHPTWLERLTDRAAVIWQLHRNNLHQDSWRGYRQNDT